MPIQSGPWKVLVLGGDDMILGLLKDPVAGHEIEVRRLESVGDALHALREQDHELVIGDLSACESGDFACIEEARQLRPSARIIVIVSDSTPEKVVASVRRNAFCYFSRPFDKSMLRLMIERGLVESNWEGDIEVISAKPDFFSLRLRCRLSTADRIMQFLYELKIGLEETERDRIATAFREMLLNAIEHGGKLDETQWVRVSYMRTKWSVIYHLMDPGEGFRHDELDHAASDDAGDDIPPEHLVLRESIGMRAGGYGMLMARRMVDEVIYSERGNEVVLIKYINGEAERN